MKHYFKVYFALAALSAKRYFENRWNTVGNLSASIVTLFLTLIFIEIYFSFANQIFGWNKYQVFLLIGFFKIINSLFEVLVLRGIRLIPYYIQRGELDYLLTKPVSSQFLLSFRFTKPHELISVLSGFILVGYSLSKLGSIYYFTNWLLLGISLFSGLIILYGIYFSVASLSVWLVRFESMTDIHRIIQEPLSMPVDIFGKRASFLLTFIFPLGFIVTVPVKLFLSKTPEYFVVLSIFFAFITLMFSIWFWNYSLKHYTSASS